MRIFIFLILGLSFVVTNAFSVDEKPKPGKEIKEIVLTPEQMKRYAAIYRDPYVLHIRKVISNYLSGKLVGEDNYNDLKAVDQEYLRNKFIVLSVKDGLMGGCDILLIPQKKPDKVFWAWVYRTGDSYELRVFEVKEYTDEEIKNIRNQFKRYLQDKNLAL